MSALSPQARRRQDRTERTAARARHKERASANEIEIRRLRAEVKRLSNARDHVATLLIASDDRVEGLRADVARLGATRCAERRRMGRLCKHLKGADESRWMLEEFFAREKRARDLVFESVCARIIAAGETEGDRE